MATIVLAIKHLSIAELLIRANSIVQTMAAHPGTYPTPVPPLAKVLADIDALREAQAEFQSHTTPKSVRDEKKATLTSDLIQLKMVVQQATAKHPEDAVLIASQAAMTIWMRKLHNKAPLVIKRLLSGSVRLVAKAIKGAKTYEWQYSLDGGSTWLDLPPTTKASTTIHGLIPTTVIVCRHRWVTKDGRADWRDPVSILVT